MCVCTRVCVCVCMCVCVQCICGAGVMYSVSVHVFVHAYLWGMQTIKKGKWRQQVNRDVKIIMIYRCAYEWIWTHSFLLVNHCSAKPCATGYVLHGGNIGCRKVMFRHIPVILHYLLKWLELSEVVESSQGTTEVLYLVCALWIWNITTCSYTINQQYILYKSNSIYMQYILPSNSADERYLKLNLHCIYKSYVKTCYSRSVMIIHIRHDYTTTYIGY